MNNFISSNVDSPVFICLPRNLDKVPWLWLFVKLKIMRKGSTQYKQTSELVKAD